MSNHVKSTSPAEWVLAVLPDKKGPTNSKHTVTIGDWTLYMNTKALTANAGQEGGVYPESKTFSPKPIKQYIGLYVLQDLGPSPQIKMKLKPQFIDPLNGNDLCYEVFGMNGDKEHTCFKAFLLAKIQCY